MVLSNWFEIKSTNNNEISLDKTEKIEQSVFFFQYMAAITFCLVKLRVFYKKYQISICELNDKTQFYKFLN